MGQPGPGLVVITLLNELVEAAVPSSRIKDKNGEKSSHLQQMFGGRGRAAEGMGPGCPGGDAPDGWDRPGSGCC